MTEETGKRYSVTAFELQRPDLVGYDLQLVLTDSHNPDFRYEFWHSTIEPWSQLTKSNKDYILHKARSSFKEDIAAYERAKEPDEPAPWWREYDKEIAP